MKLCTDDNHDQLDTFNVCLQCLDSLLEIDRYDYCASLQNYKQGNIVQHICFLGGEG